MTTATRNAAFVVARAAFEVACNNMDAAYFAGKNIPAADALMQATRRALRRVEASAI